MTIIIAFLMGLAIGIPGCVFLGIVLFLRMVNNQRCGFTQEDIDIAYHRGMIHGEHEVLSKFNRAMDVSNR